MNEPSFARGAHMVGAINLESVEDVFTRVPAVLGDRLRRLPDGEPGSRRLFISYQYPFLRAQTFLEPAPDLPTFFLPLLRVKPRVDDARIRFGELGYAREARASFQQFDAAQRAGRIPSRCRFQVSLPTPLEVLHAFVEPRSLPRVEPAYQDAMLRDLADICRAIPHDKLAIQWDLCTEMILWDRRLIELFPQVWYPPFPNLEDGLAERVARLSSAVPEGVELGYHLCYGDLDHKHFIDPDDTAKMVGFANAISARVHRRIDYWHMPALARWTTPAPYEPLRGLARAPETELYLGVVHHHDGVEGTRARIAAAGQIVPRFGIATECGMGRRDAAQIDELLRVHAACCAEVEGRAASD